MEAKSKVMKNALGANAIPNKTDWDAESKRTQEATQKWLEKMGLSPKAKNALGANAAYNPQIAYDAWNRKILHGMATLHGDAKTIEKILVHNLTQELNPMDKVDNDRLLNKVRGLIGDVEKLMAKY